MRLIHAVLLLVPFTACGDVETMPAVVDAPASETDAPTSTTDGPLPEEGGPIHVTLHSWLRTASPVSGAQVVVSDAAGARTAPTDGDGKAAVQGRTGAAVTVVQRNPTSKSATIVTILGAKPGDELRLGRPTPLVTSSNGDMSVTLKTTPPGTVGAYAFFNGCDRAFTTNASQAATLDFSRCTGEQHDIIVTALDKSGIDGKVVAWNSALDRSFVDGGTIEITGAWKNPATLTATLEGLPSDRHSLVVDRWNRQGELVYDNAHVRREQPSVDPLKLPFANPGTDAVIVTELGTGPNDDGQFFAQAITPATAYQLKVDKVLLPWVSKPTFDAATRTLRWVETGTATHDATIVTINYKSSAGSIGWIVIAPPESTSVVLPDLPADLDDVDTAADTKPSTISVELLEIPDIAGYDAFRPDAEPTLQTVSEARRTGHMGSFRDVRFSRETFVAKVKAP